MLCVTMYKANIPVSTTRPLITSKLHRHKLYPPPVSPSPSPSLIFPRDSPISTHKIPQPTTPNLEKNQEIMSQKREKEETLELKVPAAETLTTGLCPENCKISAPATAISTSNNAGSSVPDPARVDPGLEPPPPPDRCGDGADRRDSEANAAAGTKKAVNRCLCCGKRVGLTGFRCRCGELFCSVHRYSDRHDCNFDYKAAGREAIARENPVVRAAKILKV